MQLDFGHGFVPRIDKRNWTGADSALGPPGRLPFDDPLDLPGRSSTLPSPTTSRPWSPTSTRTESR